MLRRRSIMAPRMSNDWTTAAILFGIASVGAGTSICVSANETSRLNSRNGWQAFDVISMHDDPPEDGFSWSMPGAFDGLGASLPDSSTLRLQINHETFDATISEVNLDLASFRRAISNMINDERTGGVTFVVSARQAYDRWTSNGGSTWTYTADASTTSFQRFCSGQSYSANTFGLERGFVDPVYITGEEHGASRLFALDLSNRDLYQLSGVAGSAAGGIGGIPFDSWENAALLDTGETDHVALLLSPDGGSQHLQLYIGQKERNADGHVSTDFLARNGLAYGSYYHLHDVLPRDGTSTNGTFAVTVVGALKSTKLEDIDTSPSRPTRVVLGDQDSGLFTFDFSLDFSDGSFRAAESRFSITKIQDHINDLDGAFGDADNVDWTGATQLDGVTYADGLIFVNEDSGTHGGEIWMVEPGGSGLTRIGDTIGDSSSRETSGILDISPLIGYMNGSVLLTSLQGNNASLSVLINPHATPVPGPGDFNGDGVASGLDIDHLTAAVITGQGDAMFDLNNDKRVDQEDRRIWVHDFKRTNFGDADLDGKFDTGDFAQVFEAGKYETPNYASWSEGDWNGDSAFDAGDFVIAFQDGGYERGPRTDVASVPEPSVKGMLWLPGLAAIWFRRMGKGDAALFAVNELRPLYFSSC